MNVHLFINPVCRISAFVFVCVSFNRGLLDFVSERVYVKDLEQCVDYIKYMRETKVTDDQNEIAMPEDLKEGKDRMIFGNIEQIYEWHRE